jgi:MFS family permease
MPGTFLASYLINTPLGRTKTTAFSLMLAGVLCVAFIIPFSFTGLLILSSVAWFLVFIGYSGKYTITPESYYADIRSKSVAIHSIFGQVGGIITNFVAGTMMYYELFDWLVIMYSACLVISGVVCLFIKETKGLDIDSHLSLSSTKKL